MYQQGLVELVEIRQFLQELPHSGRHLLGLLAEQGEQLTSIKVLKDELRNYIDGEVVMKRSIHEQLKAFSQMATGGIEEIRQQEKRLPEVEHPTPNWKTLQSMLE